MDSKETIPKIEAIADELAQSDNMNNRAMAGVLYAALGAYRTGNAIKLHGFIRPFAEQALKDIQSMDKN